MGNDAFAVHPAIGRGEGAEGGASCGMVRPPRQPSLVGLVDVLWATGAARAHTAEEWSMPTGRVHLAFRPCGSGIVIDRAERFDGWVVGGPRAKAHLRDTPDGACSVGAMLAPGTAALVLGVPAGVLGGRHVALRDLWGTLADELADTIHALADSPAAALERFEATLAARVAGRRPSRRARLLTAAIEAGQPLAEVGARLDLAERRVRELCWDTLGLSPRDARRVARLQRVFDDWRRDAARPWGDRAMDLGYADQAHLVREFKDLTGFTPGRWHPAPGEPNHVPVPNRRGSDRPASWDS
jgi:AraC-like DNA-binding protein